MPDLLSSRSQFSQHPASGYSQLGMAGLSAYEPLDIVKVVDITVPEQGAFKLTP